ncbi:hypothetical protein [Cryobacterium sp. TMS1-13-1]|uniref:hypothetical protein n=1 Tax=Cryobacterium sp. TMS1-13-1 TaxID=1259220 RepID=UPI00106B5501|nr:hypothetical protein [Cryobacterium sp. TMS1-13-1]TFD19489.1 hypothetical protein E3T31_15265 [Cryobacterium sp. TMS1-13-1]
MSVKVLPEATAQWQTYAATTAVAMSEGYSTYGDASYVDCFNFGEYFTCTANILAGANWIDAYVRALNSDPSASNEAVAELAAPLITDIVNTVTGAPAPEPLWVAPASTGELPTDCSIYATADDFRAAFSTADEILISGDGDGEGWGIDDAGWTIVGGERCVWAPESTGQTWPLLVTALPGGEWAFDRSARLMTAGDTVRAVTETIGGIDRATFGCHVYSGFCTLDTVIAGNWVQFSAEQEMVGTEHDVQALLISIAERAVGRFPS